MCVCGARKTNSWLVTELYGTFSTLVKVNEFFRSLEVNKKALFLHQWRSRLLGKDKVHYMNGAEMPTGHHNHPSSPLQYVFQEQDPPCMSPLGINGEGLSNSDMNCRVTDLKSAESIIPPSDRIQYNVAIAPMFHNVTTHFSEEEETNSRSGSSQQLPKLITDQ